MCSVPTPFFPANWLMLLGTWGRQPCSGATGGGSRWQKPSITARYRWSKLTPWSTRISCSPGLVASPSQVSSLVLPSVYLSSNFVAILQELDGEIGQQLAEM